MAKDEPQSYGSQGDWVKGNTGEQVNRQKSEPEAHAAFYDDRRESETSGPHQGGHISEVQFAENNEPVGKPQPEDEFAAKKVTDADGGAIRDGYFKKRDYPE